MIRVDLTRWAVGNREEDPAAWLKRKERVLEREAVDHAERTGSPAQVDATRHPAMACREITLSYRDVPRP